MYDFLESYVSILGNVLANEYFRYILFTFFLVSMIHFLILALRRLIGPIPCDKSNKVDSIDQAEEDLDDDPEEDSDDDSDEYWEYESEDDSFDYVLKGDDFE